MIPNFGQNTNRLEINVTEKLKIQKSVFTMLNSLITLVIPKKFGKQLIQSRVDPKRTLLSTKSMSMKRIVSIIR